MSAHNICFRGEIKKIFIGHPPLFRSVGLKFYFFLRSYYLRYLEEWQTVLILIRLLLQVCAVCICHFISNFGV